MPIDPLDEPTLLIVDDEPQVGVALSDLFETEFRVVTETSPEAALDILKANRNIVTVISDQRMPGMNGDAFLSIARDLSPASRLLITGYADLGAVVRAVNEGQIFGYISKPWDEEGVRLTVHKAYEYFTLRRELNHERALLHDLMRHSPDAVAFKDTGLNYLQLNQAEAEILGIDDPTAAVGKSAAEFLSSERWHARLRVEEGLLRGTRSHEDYVELVKTPNHGVRWYAAKSASIRNENHKVTGLVGITRDVTDQKWTETGLALLLDLTHAITDAPDPLQALEVTAARICEALDWEYAEAWVPNSDGSELTLAAVYQSGEARAAVLRHGARKARVARGEGPIGRTWESAKIEWLADLARSDEQLPRLKARQSHFKSALLAPIATGSGAPQLHAVLAFYIHEVIPEPTHIRRLIENIVQQIARDLAAKEAGARLRQSEQQFRSLVEGSIQGIAIHREGVPLFVNDAMARIFGYDNGDEILALGEIRLLLAPDERARLRGYMHARLSGGEAPNAYEFRGIRKDGSEIWLQALSNVVSWQNAPAILFTVVDITERSLAMNALREREAQLENAQRIAGIGSFASSLVDREAHWSRQLYAFFGRDPKGYAASLDAFVEHIHIDGREEFLAARQRALAGEGPLEYSGWFVRADGTRRYAIVEGEIERDGAGKPVRLSGTVQDITEKRELELRLSRSQKLEAIGQLTGGVAHDFNNLLGVVLGNLELLKRNFGGGERALRWLRSAERATLRGADLTKRLLVFSRQQVLEAKRVDVNEIVSGFEEMFRRTLAENVQIETLLEPAAWPVRLDPGELENALLNLVVNARDAMPDGGCLTIETANVVLDQKYVQSHDYADPGQYLMLAVSDTGQGMSEEVLEHIFEPFFTTKEAGRGTGLGMSMVYGFVKQSEGHVEIYSEVGKGTTIKLYFPRLLGDGDPEASHEPAEAKAHVVDDIGRKILIVEDDEALSETLAEMLRDLGYETMEARDGADALAKIEQDAGIDLIITDYVMPGGMDGLELIRAAKARNPEIKAVLTSGYTRRAVLRRDDLDEGLDWIAKPYRWDEVASKLRAAFEHDSSE